MHTHSWCCKWVQCLHVWCAGIVVLAYHDYIELCLRGIHLVFLVAARDRGDLARGGHHKHGIDEAIDTLDDATPICGWRLEGRLMRFLRLSAYYGVSLSIGGATHFQSQDCANTFGPESPHWGVEWPNWQQS